MTLYEKEKLRKRITAISFQLLLTYQEAAVLTNLKVDIIRAAVNCAKIRLYKNKLVRSDVEKWIETEAEISEKGKRFLQIMQG